MDCTCPCQDGLALAYATQELQGDEDIVEAVPFYFSMGGRFQNFTHTYTNPTLILPLYSFLRHPCPARIWPRFVGNVGNVVFVQLVAESAAHWCLVNSNSADKLRRKAVCNGQAAVAENPLALQYASDRWRCDKVGTCWHLVQPV